MKGKKLVLELQGSEDSPESELLERRSAQTDIAGVAVAMVRQFDRRPRKREQLKL